MVMPKIKAQMNNNYSSNNNNNNNGDDDISNTSDYNAVTAISIVITLISQTSANSEMSQP